MRRLFTLFLLISVVSLYAMEQEMQLFKVPHASYAIARQKRAGELFAQQTTFYTFDGNPITTTITDKKGSSMIESQLDHYAPKPQPTTYKIKLLPTGFAGFAREYKPFIIFYDKNGNRIKHYPYDNVNQRIKVQEENTVTHHPFVSMREDKKFPLDLSIVQEKIQ